jgi:L-fucose isomerase
MDLTGVISTTPWAGRPSFVEGTDRPLPLIYHLNGGQAAYKALK